MTTISLRLDDKLAADLDTYVKLNRISVSQALREAIADKVEDFIDYRTGERAWKEHQKNPITYTHAEVKKMFKIE